MDSSNVLLALEEQKKWRERRTRLEARLEQLARRRAYLARDLDHARKKIGEYAGVAVEARTLPPPAQPSVPTILYLR
jgi:hypothetical protein